MRHLLARHRKSYARLRRAIASQSRPARGLLDRLRRYERQLQRGGIAVAATVALLTTPDTLVAQAQPVGGEVQVNTFTTSNQEAPATAMDADGNYIIVWQGEGQGGDYDVFGQRYNADGTTAGAEFRVNTYTTSKQNAPTVAMDADGDFVVAWQSSGQDGSNFGVFARRFQADGTALDANDVPINIFTTNNQTRPSVAMAADGDFVVAWHSRYQDGSSYGIYARRYQADGTALDVSDVPINTHTTSTQRLPSVAMAADGNFIVAWQSKDQDGSSYGIYTRRFQADGTALDAGDVPINTYTTANQETPSVAMAAEGDFVVTWHSPHDGSGFGVFARRFQANGTAFDASDVQVNIFTQNNQIRSSVAMDADGNFVVAWEGQSQDGSGTGIFSRRYQADGTVLDANDVQVNTFTTDNQKTPSVAMAADGDFVIAWESGSPFGMGQNGNYYYGIYAQRYEAPAPPFTERVPAGPETQVNTYTTLSQRSSATAMDADGDYVIVWTSNGQDGSGYGIYGQRYNADGTTAGVEFKVNEYTFSVQRNPSVAMDADGDFVVAWESYFQDGDGTGIFARRYQADGTALDVSDVQINNVTYFDQRNASVAMDADGDFVIAWESDEQDGFRFGIFARRYQADGTALDASDVPINTFTSNSQQRPSIAIDADGDYIIAWESELQDGDGYGIFARRYQADGTALDASDVLINTYTTNYQQRPSVAMDADGNYIIAWQSGNYAGVTQDGSSYGVFARRYQADGTALDASDVPINTYTTSYQQSPSVAMDADGDFVVVWESRGQDNDDDGVFARQYRADGTAVGSEIQVNTYTTMRQRNPSVAMDTNGNFVVAWESGIFNSAGQDGDRYGIYAQRYGDAALPVELLDLRATALPHSNLITWTTATESANEGFAVQRSYDGKQWEVIGWVAGAGESYTAQQYEHEDRMPREGVTYYRLEQLDYDGTATLTEVVSVVRTEDEVMQELRAYPNPVSGLLTVENAGAELHLYALTGQLVLTRSTQGDDRAKLDVSSLAEGVYLLTTTLESGEVRQVRIVVR